MDGSTNNIRAALSLYVLGFLDSRSTRKLTSRCIIALEPCCPLRKHLDGDDPALRDHPCTCLSSDFGKDRKVEKCPKLGAKLPLRLELNNSLFGAVLILKAD